ncbi:MAG: peptide ABC transporter substrate-binding protein [Patescibacteria group bacterium]|nr:peptide ABC transporter substrate-binding protein [Patescibacteria group bacterium]
MPDRTRRPTLLRIRPIERAHEIVGSLSPVGRVIFYTLAGLIIASGIGLIAILNGTLLIKVPARGGSYTEGVIGSPRFINPLLAISDSDEDLTALVYSGLLRAAPDGSYTPDLASSYNVSPDGKTYTVHIRPNARFQNGTPVTADDVVFTVQEAQDPSIKSPLEANWQGISVQAPDPQTVVFTLQKPYAPFVANLTMGILPKALWQNVSAEDFPFSELNTQPIGSGPYEVGSIARTSSGVASSYTLTANPSYALGEPYITTLTLKFYQSEDDLISALKGGAVEGASGISSESLPSVSGTTVLSVPLSRVFGVFFNQNQSVVLRDPAVRQALSDAIDRSALIQSVLAGYATPLVGPIPPALGGTPYTPATTTSDLVFAAQKELLSKGWTLGSNGVLQKTTGSGKNAQTTELSFTLSTGDVPELSATAEFLKAAWTRMGAQVNVEVYAQGDLSENVIRPRKYDALLFGEVVGRTPDLFAFWDSSQRNDPGLNIALYANSTVDSLVEQLRTVSDLGQREALYQKIEAQIAADAPAVFLYSPDFVYVVPSDIEGIAIGPIDNPSDRFDTIENWYRQTDHVWPIFAGKTN